VAGLAGIVAVLGEDMEGRSWYVVTDEHVPDADLPGNAALLVAAPEMYEALVDLLGSVEQLDIREGVCCCGSAMDHDAMEHGHTPVDAGEYHHGPRIEAARAALRKAVGG
jgi:hypothetical protein